MANDLVPQPDLALAQMPQSRVNPGDIERQGDEQAQALGRVSSGLGDLAVPLAEQAGRDAVQKSITRNADGSISVSTPASSFILGEAGAHYASTVLAGEGAALRTQMDQDFTNLRQQHQGDAAGFQRASGAYVDQMVAGKGGPIAAMVQSYGNQLAVQYRDGIANDVARLQVQGALDGQKGRISYLENAMNGIAGDGGATLPAYQQMKAERSALQDAMVGNPLSGYTAQQRANDDAVFDQSIGTAAAVGHGRRIYEDTHNLSAAVQATQDDLSKVDGLSEGQKIRATGEVSAHLRGLDATWQQAGQELKDQADTLITQSKATGNVPQTQIESTAQQLEGRRLFAKAAEVRAQGVFQSYAPAIVGGSGQDATDALRKVIGAAAGGSQPNGQPLTGPGAPTSAYLHRLAQIEDPSGDPNATSSTGAKGLFQFTPGTWARYGNGGDPTNTADATAAVVRLTNDNAASLTKSLGRAPTPGEVYLAHQQGAAGATALIQNPGANAVQALSLAYGGNVGRAAAAITGNGGNIHMTAGQFASMWTTRFAAGGGVGSSQDGSPVIAYNGLLRESYAAFNQHAQKLWDGMTQNGWDKGYAPTPAEMSDLRAMAPYITDDKLRQDISQRLQSQDVKDSAAKMPLAQQQDMLAAGDLMAQRGDLDNVQRQSLAALGEQVKQKVALAANDPVTYAAQSVRPDAKAGPSQVPPLDMSSQDAFAAAIKARQTLKGQAQKFDRAVGDMPFTLADKDQLVDTLQRGPGPAVAGVLNTMGATLRPEEMNAVLGDDRLKGAILATSRSTDPAKASAAFGFLDRQYRANPLAFQARFGNDTIQDLRAWQSNIATQTPEVAVARLQRAYDPDEIEARDRLKKVADDNLRSVSADAVVDKFRNPPSWLGTILTAGGANLYSRLTAPGAPLSDEPAMSKQALWSDYAKNYKDAFARSGDAADADRTATELLALKWGVSEANGNTVTAYPPERYYPAVNGGHAYITDQINAAIDGYVQHEHPGWSMGQQGENARTMRGSLRALVPDVDTQAEIAAGKPPGYSLVVAGSDGRLAAVPDLQRPGKLLRLHFDPGPAQKATEDDFTAKRKAYFDNQQMPAIGPM